MDQVVQVSAGNAVEHGNTQPHNHGLGDSYLSNQIPIADPEVANGVYMPAAAAVSNIRQSYKSYSMTHTDQLILGRIPV